MRRGKADRWERIADKSWHNWEAAVTPTRIAQLLRREHRATLRIIKHNTLLSTDTKFDEGWNHCLEDLLFILRKRAR